jgi:GGDEF domain-containing protein
MSLVSLNKYLLGHSKDTAAAGTQPLPENYLDLTTRTMAAIRRSVVVGESFVDLFEEIDMIRKDLHVESGCDVVNQCATRLEDLLATYQKRLRQAEIDRSAELRNVLDMLNETLSYLTTGTQKTEDRRKQLETNLSMAGRIDDISSLRSYLTKVLQSVRESGRQDSHEAQEVIERLGRQIAQVHKAQSRFNSELPGRASAMEYLKQLWHTDPPPSNLHVALFVADSLKVIRERHGDEVASLILQDLGRKHLKDLTPTGEVFAWSPNALVLIWQHTDDNRPATDISSRLKQPCEQRAFVGTRVAIFNVMLRSLVVQARENSEEIEQILDRFVRRA